MLYRARNGEHDRIEDLYHSTQKSQGRFSLRGSSCLYLGSTSLCCYREISDINKNKDDNKWSVSAYRMNNKGKGLKVMNLVCSVPIINGCCFEEDRDLQNDMVKIFPLIIATSIHVIQKGPYNNEYRLSNLITECLEIMAIDGICYSSTCNINDFQYPHGVNYAFPVRGKSEKDPNYGVIMDYFDVSKPLIVRSDTNKDELSKCCRGKSYINTVYPAKGPLLKNTFNQSAMVWLSQNEKICYQETIYSIIDDFLETQFE